MKFKILRSSEYLTRVILIGSSAIDILLVSFLFLRLSLPGHEDSTGRILIGIIVLLYLGIVGYLVQSRHVRTRSWMLVALYAIVGILILHTWGINAPIGILVLSFVILLTSVMLGAKYILSVTIAIIATLLLLQYLNLIGLSRPDISMLANESSFGDVASYSILFCVFAVVAWLSGIKMEHALERATDAETQLQTQRDALAIRLEEQTKSLKSAQQKELKQLYTFAELGQLTTIILHELANYLSVLTLDIDDLRERHENSLAIEHAKESIFYIDSIIDQVRNQIKNSDTTVKFDALSIIKDSLEQLRKKLTDSNIKLFIEDDVSKSYYIFGDPLRLSQAITILVTNAAQAASNKQSEISVQVSSTKSKILISVKDLGTGITKSTRQTLFQPQKSKKGGGLGIGLYVTKQIVDTHFKGKIWLSLATDYTQFNIEIPIIKSKQNT